MVKKGYKQTAEHIAKRIKSGPSHPNWKGDQITVKSGRSRALRAMPVIGPCSICGSPRSERHHLDDNTANNSPENLAVLCRRCHMAKDGRLEKFIEQAKGRIRELIQMAAQEKLSRNKCKRGHPLSGENLYVNPKGARCCKTCQREAVSRYQKTKKDSK